MTNKDTRELVVKLEKRVRELESKFVATPQTNQIAESSTLNHKNMFGNFHRWTFLDGTEYTHRELSVGEVVKYMDHLYGIEHTLTREEEEEGLKNWVVPLAHETLTREEVAERCIAAAEKKGYEIDPDPRYAVLSTFDVAFEKEAFYFLARTELSGCGFREEGLLTYYPKPLTTLEAFEAYCEVEKPQTTMSVGFQIASDLLWGKPEKQDGKTRLDWLNELPDGYRERALANCKEWKGRKPTDVCDSMAIALLGMCDWDETPEKREFWRAVRNHYNQGTPLPPLPQEPEPIYSELGYVKKHFNLEKVLEFERKHRVEIILGSDCQYHCHIDKAVYATGVTPSYALVVGIMLYEDRNR